MNSYYVYTNTKINMVSHEFNLYQLIVIINKYKKWHQRYRDNIIQYKNSLETFTSMKNLKLILTPKIILST